MISNSLRNESPGFKVCICGQQGVGKTAMLNRRTSGVFNADYRPTIAAAFATVMEKVNDKTISLSVWDTAGQEKYQNMMPLYFRNVACVILVLDVTAPPSWDFVKRWAGTELPGIRPRPILFLCLNKTDLKPTIDIEAIEEWAQQRDIPLFRTSASTGDNIAELFREVAATLATRKRSKSESMSEQLEGDAQPHKCC
jgi:small GTP-binding protein